jgi:membrane-bound ClpP family serine protease
MQKLTLLLTCLLLAVPSVGDTFTHRKTGEVFQGYTTQEKRGNKTLVRIGDKQAPEYLDLADYDVELNPSGRRNQVIILPIKTEVELECETEAFEKAIEIASNQGPLFILIEIDTPGGRVDLMKRICNAIIKTNNCRIVAFVSGGNYGGAYSAGAIIALACDYIYMADGTAIGAATPILVSSSEVKDLKSTFGEAVGEKLLSAERAYIASLAEQNGRPGLLAKAMVDKDIEVWEVIENGKTRFIEPENKKPEQTVVRVWSKKGSLLTLTAVEADQCGIADKVVTSRDELFAELAATKAKQVYNKDTLKAKQEFEKVQREFNEILLSISSVEKRVTNLANEIATLDEVISRTDKVIYYNGISEDGWTYSGEERQYNPTAVKEFFHKGEQCLKLSEGLRKNYKKALLLAKKHSDLYHHINDIEKGLNFAEATHKEVLSRFP